MHYREMAANTQRTTLTLSIIIALALALRLALWLQPLHEPANDETEYVAVAYDLVQGRGWEFYTHYHWLRAPLYPLFLAGSLWLAQDNLYLAALPNIVLSVATVPLVFLLTATLYRPMRERERIATHHPRFPPPLLAALLTALLFTLATFASLYMSETLFTFLFTAAMLLLLRWKSSPFPGPPALLIFGGVLYGLATLTRSVSLAFLPVVVLWMVVQPAQAQGQSVSETRTPWLQRIRANLASGVLFVLFTLLTIAPWTLRNCYAYGRCIAVETGLSYNLWAFSEPHEDMDEIFRTLENIPNPAERADEAMGRGMERLREDPTIVLRKPWPNWIALWRIKPIQDRFLLPTYYADPPPLVFLGALLFDDALYVVILATGVMGMAMLLTQRETRYLSLLPLLWIAYITFTTMMTHGEGRYRHFFFPQLIAFAAIGIIHMRAWLPTVGRSAHRLLALLVSLVLIGVLLYTVGMFYPWKWAVGGAERSVHRLVGDVAYALGNTDAAEAAYQRAYAAQKTADGRLILGNLYRSQGQIARAEEQYRSGWRRKKRYVAATALLGDSIRAQGREEEAREAFAGYFVAEQDVTAWSWQHLHPPPTECIDVGNGLDFGYVGNVHNAEVQQQADARWTNGQGLIRLVAPASDNTGGGQQSWLLSLRLAAPHPGVEHVAAQVCTPRSGVGGDGVLCQPIVLERTWRTVWLLLPATVDAEQVIEIRSPTFTGLDGRELGVLVDRVCEEK
jgi:4-amino-4-deoxy-L-arabinose transferase-like glycosyltransferase